MTAERTRKLHARPRELALLGAVVATALGAPALLIATDMTDPVSVVSGLSAPVTVDFDGSRVEVPAGGRAVVDLSVGRHHARVTSGGGELLEEGAFTVPPGTDA